MFEQTVFGHLTHTEKDMQIPLEIKLPEELPEEELSETEK